MSKVQDYIKRRRIEELGLPKIWMVKSDRTGVSKPHESQVVNIIEGIAFRGEERTRIDRYQVEETPYNIDIVNLEKSTSIDGYGSGIGDLWSWTYYCTFSKEDADTYYEKELYRITEKYGVQNNQE